MEPAAQVLDTGDTMYRFHYITEFIHKVTLLLCSSNSLPQKWVKWPAGQLWCRWLGTGSSIAEHGLVNLSWWRDKHVSQWSPPPTTCMQKEAYSMFLGNLKYNSSSHIAYWPECTQTALAISVTSSCPLLSLAPHPPSCGTMIDPKLTMFSNSGLQVLLQCCWQPTATKENEINLWKNNIQSLTGAWDKETHLKNKIPKVDTKEIIIHRPKGKH